MRAAALAFVLLALNASAEDPKPGTAGGDWKGGVWAVWTPADWTKADGGKYTLWVTTIPRSHEAKQYIDSWSSASAPAPLVALIIDWGVAASDYRGLIEKTVADYGLTSGKIFMAAYGEGAHRAVEFNNANPDFLTGMALLQPVVQTTASPSAAGRATAVFLMVDQGCTYASSGGVKSLKLSFEGFGYVAAMEELNDPANRDGWPVNDMGKFLSWSLGVQPFRVSDVWDAAANAIKPDSKDSEWRPKLREAVKGWQRQFGDAFSPGGAKALDAGIAVSMKDANPVVRELKAGLKASAAVLGAAKGKKIEGGSLIVCESGDFESLEDTVVICTGDVKVGKVTRSVIIAKGAITIAKECTASVLFCEGRLKAGPTLEDCTVLAVGGAEGTGKAKATWWVNTVDVKFKTNEAARDIKKRGLPGVSKK